MRTSKLKQLRLDAIKMLLSSREISSQNDLLDALISEGINITQATLSRDLKQLKVAKAASIDGRYVYVLPNETMYRRVKEPKKARDMIEDSGYLTINFSGQLAIIKTRPGYASAMAYNIDNSDIGGILGTIAGDDTIFVAVAERTDKAELLDELRGILHNM